VRGNYVPGLVLLACAATVLAGVAAEPDGRVSFRYAWVDEAGAGKDSRKLRLSVTVLAPLQDARLEASAPSGVDSFVQGWSRNGIALDGLALGSAAVIDLEVVEPRVGGEILTFSVQGLDKGVPVRESVGIPVGTPGVPPVLRNGAAEFPAARDGTNP
jgi:hypothetical protein